MVNCEGKVVGFIEIKELEDEGFDIYIFVNSLCFGVLFGFYIYEKGLCVRLDFELVGGYFNL